MALQDRLLQQLRTVLPGATDIAITAELWEVWNDVCRDGYVWRETIEVPLVAGDQSYTITVSGAEVVQVFSVSHDTMDVSDVVYEFGTLQLISASPTAADVAEGPLALVVALAPALDPGGDVEAWMPSDLWSQLHHVLLAGVKAKVMAQPAKPYSNPQMAAFHAREYRGYKAAEKRRVATGNREGAVTWTFPPFAVPSLRR